MTDLSSFLNEVRERLEKATPGPWKRDLTSSVSMQVVAHGNDVVAYHSRHPRQVDERVVPNYELIAHAPTDLTLLLKIVEEQRKALEFDRGRTINNDNAAEFVWRQSLRYRECQERISSLLREAGR